MEKTILVTGKETFLGNEIAQFFLNRGGKAAVSVPARKEAFPSVEQDKRLFVFPWNRRSAGAAKNFILQATHEVGDLEEAWVLCTPEREIFALTDLSPLALEEALDAQLLGFLFLTRELLAYQNQHPTCIVRFVFYDENPASLPPLAAMQYQGQRGTVHALLQQARKRGLPIWAYESLIPQPEAYLQYLLSAKTTGPGRWNVFGEKKNLMTSLFAKKDPS